MNSNKQTSETMDLLDTPQEIEIVKSEHEQEIVASGFNQNGNEMSEVINHTKKTKHKLKRDVK